MSEDATTAQHCFYCGQPTEDILPPANISAELSDQPGWRCYSCFSVVPGWRLHCSSCGSSHGNPQAVDFNRMYTSAGMRCSCAPGETPGKDGLQNVNHVIIGFVAILIIILVGGALRSENNGALNDLVTSGVMYTIVFGYAIANWRLVLPLFGLPRQSWLLLILALLAAPLTVGLAHLQLVVFPSLEKYWLSYSPDYLDAGFGWGTVFLSIAVGPAIFEELFFRGVMMHRLARVMTQWQAIIVTAMAFAILHLAAIGIVFYLVPLALIAGWLTFQSKSLWPAMLLHFLHNGGIVYLEYLGIQ